MTPKEARKNPLPFDELCNYDRDMCAQSLSKSQASNFSDDNWSAVLAAVDETYAELMRHQEALEERNIELENLRNFLGSVLSSVSDVLIVCDPKGKIVDSSRSFEVMAKTDRDAIIAKPFLGFVHEKDHERIKNAIEMVMIKKKPPTFEADLNVNDERIPLEFSVAPRLDDRGRAIGVTMVGRPLGELRKAYRQMEESHLALKQTQAQLVHSEKLASLGRLLAGVAHELNNPISFVYANTHALERYGKKIEAYFDLVQSGADRAALIAFRHEMKLDRELDNMRAAIDGANAGAERVRDIVEDLRRLSADGAGEMVKFDLVETSKTAMDWVLRGEGQKRHLSIKGENALLVLGRIGPVQQVVMNLVQNALDAVEMLDEPRILVEFARAGQKAILRVCDNGQGIDPKLAASIFDPFFTTKPVGKGTGLGLSISYKIAKENNGELRHVPTKTGCVFELELEGVLE